MKVNTSSWKEFKVKDIFITNKKGKKLQVPTGANVSIKELEDGDMPRVTVSNFNNGITGYYKSDSKDYRVYENFISVSFLGTVFYQPTKCSIDMKVHCLKPINHMLNKYEGMFLVSVLRNVISKFSYSDQLSSTSIVDLPLYLPSKVKKTLNLNVLAEIMGGGMLIWQQ